MPPIGPIVGPRIPDPVRRQLEVAAAAAWEALVEVHTGHALRFVALMSARHDFDVAVDRYLDELDIRDPMAAAVRSRVLIALEHALEDEPERPTLPAYDDDGEGSGSEGLRRFRPDVLMKGLARWVRETEEQDEWVRLAVARAEEGVILCHVDNAVVFVALLRDLGPLNDAVDHYLDVMRVSGARGQSVHQRAMARLAGIHLPVNEAGEDEDGAEEAPGPSSTGDAGQEQ